MVITAQVYNMIMALYEIDEIAKDKYTIKVNEVWIMQIDIDNYRKIIHLLKEQ